MSLFIHKENQTLLWDLIQQSPHWTEFLQTYNGHTQLWFKNIISLFYDKYWSVYCQTTMTVDDLKRINKEVIMFMNTDIKKSIFSSKVPEYPVSPKSAVSPPFLETTKIQKEYDTLPPFDIQSRLALYDRPTNPVSVTDIQKSQYETLKNTYDVKKEKEDKMEQAKKDFDNFQSKYNMGFERKPPPTIDFSIQMDHDRIKNMDELIQQQMAERERDLQGIPLANLQ
jgi:hypothetical protein